MLFPFKAVMLCCPANIHSLPPLAVSEETPQTPPMLNLTKWPSLANEILAITM